MTEELSDLSPPSSFQFFHGFTDPPSQDGNCEPCQPRDGKDGRTGVTGQEAPNQYCECNQAQSPHRRPYCIDASGASASPSAIETGSPLFFPLLLLDQRGSSGKNRWKCEEESGDTRTITPGYQSRKRRYDAAEDETHSVVPPAKVLHRGNIKSDSHSSVLSRPDKPEPKGSGQPYQHECRCRN